MDVAIGYSSLEGFRLGIAFIPLPSSLCGSGAVSVSSTSPNNSENEGSYQLFDHCKDMYSTTYQSMPRRNAKYVYLDLDLPTWSMQRKVEVPQTLFFFPKSSWIVFNRSYSLQRIPCCVAKLILLQNESPPTVSYWAGGYVKVFFSPSTMIHDMPYPVLTTKRY